RDVAAGAGPVFHDDGLADVFAELLRNDAGSDIGAAARGEADDHRHRPARKLRLRKRARRGESEKDQGWDSGHRSKRVRWTGRYYRVADYNCTHGTFRHRAVSHALRGHAPAARR